MKTAIVVKRRTFEASKHLKGTTELETQLERSVRTRLNLHALTSEYMPSHRYIVIEPDGGGGRDSTRTFRTKAEANAEAERLRAKLKPPHEIVEFVVPRAATDETTVAIVRAKVARHDTALFGSGPFRDRLTSAVTKWVQETEAGRGAWKASSGDLNVGDLLQHVDDADLRARCAHVGIHNLEITYCGHDSAATWTYDEVLVDTAAIAADEVAT